ncbi:hypothetical protein ZIOFF_056135 [Zingiber officinale]|uniref:CSC1/OSCA1-like N-terminal transmembrane domain-containing protein n=1 Tax=Zingiber officinale TaxID=94328 RepID=A0A8J5KF69_ZINOF|nr:hypothetical protein ZIOFF_056135 [Zingiber officinale]
MASLQDIGMSAAVNIITALIFLMVFAMLRLQPFNDRVYFPKWYLKGIRSSPTHSGNIMRKFVNLDCRTYLRFLNWMPAALRMPEPELIDHAGLDSSVYVRIYLLGLKIFAPITVLAFGILVPVNWTGGTLEKNKDLTFSDLDKLSISNIELGSQRFFLSFPFLLSLVEVKVKDDEDAALDLAAIRGLDSSLLRWLHGTQSVGLP